MKPYHIKLIKLIKKHGSNSAVARLIGVDESNVRRWASGERSIPGWLVADLLANKFFTAKAGKKNF